MSSNTFTLGTKSVNRLGYGAMQLAGPGVFGPPRDRHVAITVLREALALGVNHIDTSDFYGPHVTNQIIREALYPYSDDLTIVTKIGARRGEDASWLPAFSPAELQKAVHDKKIDSIFVYRCWIWWFRKRGSSDRPWRCWKHYAKSKAAFWSIARWDYRAVRWWWRHGCYVTDIVKPLMKRLVIFEPDARGLCLRKSTKRC